MNMGIRYGGRAAGAFVAYKYLRGMAGGGTVGLVAVIALGWLAGGLVGDFAAAKFAPADTSVGNFQSLGG